MLNANPRDGTVTDTVPAIAQRCGLPLLTVEEILKWFSDPDPYSRTQSNDGRRIERTPEGIRLLTYVTHRDRDYSTPRVKAFRERRKLQEDENETLKHRSTVSEGENETLKHRSTVSETTDTDTDTDKDISQSVSAADIDPHTSPARELTDSISRVRWDPVAAELWLHEELWSAICEEYPDIHEDDLQAVIRRLSRWLDKHPDQLIRYADELEPWLRSKLREDCERIRRIVLGDNDP